MPRILQLMKQRGIKSVAELAKLTGIPKSTLAAIVRGRSLMNDPDRIKRIAEVLGVQPEDLY